MGRGGIEKELKFNKDLLSEISRRIKLKLILSLSSNFDELKLDVGCGDKRYTKHLKNCIGIDPFPDYQEGLVVNTPDIKAISYALPFKDGIFSEVHFHDVLEHISELKETIIEVDRVLKKDGKMIALLPHDRNWWILKVLLWKWSPEKPSDHTKNGFLHKEHLRDLRGSKLLDYVNGFISEKTDQIPFRIFPLTTGVRLCKD